MKFSDIFWTTLKVRASIKIQDALVDSVVESRRRATLSANMPDIIRELLENDSYFGTFMEKERKLIQINKALSGLETVNLITDEQKKIAREELIKIKNFLEN